MQVFGRVRTTESSQAVMCHRSIDWPGIAHNRTSRWSNIHFFSLCEMSFHCGWCRSTNVCSGRSHHLDMCALFSHASEFTKRKFAISNAPNLNINSKLHKWSERTLFSRPKLLMIAMLMRSSSLRAVTRGRIVCSSLKTKIEEKETFIRFRWHDFNNINQFND